MTNEPATVYLPAEKTASTGSVLDLGGIISAIDRTKAQQDAGHQSTIDVTQSNAPQSGSITPIKPTQISGLSIADVVRALEGTHKKERTFTGQATWDWLVYRRDLDDGSFEYAVLNPDLSLITYADKSKDYPMEPERFVKEYFSLRENIETEKTATSKKQYVRPSGAYEDRFCGFGIIPPLCMGGGLLGVLAGTAAMAANVQDGIALGADAVIGTLFGVIFGVAHGVREYRKSMKQVATEAQEEAEKARLIEAGKERLRALENRFTEFSRKHDIRTGMDAYYHLTI